MRTSSSTYFWPGTEDQFANPDERNSARLVMAEPDHRDCPTMLTLGRVALEVGHDLNHILAAIRLNCELLQHKTGNAAMVPLQRIVESASAGELIVKRIFDLADSREESVADPDSFIGQFADEIRALLPSGKQLELNLGAGEFLILLSSGELASVLLNLVLNARDAIDDRGMIAITTRVAEKQFVLEVSDNGGGLSSAPSTREPGKRGMGLLTVSTLVHQAGGTLTVRSSRAGGTTMSILLPCGARALRDPDTSERSSRGKHSAGGND